MRKCEHDIELFNLPELTIYLSSAHIRGRYLDRFIPYSLSWLELITFRNSPEHGAHWPKAVGAVSCGKTEKGRIVHLANGTFAH